MMDFVGKICPYCKQELGAYDNVVVCTSCKMPHHKECWEESRGCTTFGCMGSAKSAQDYEFNKPIYCIKCGTPNNNTDRFCVNCGEELVHIRNKQSSYGGYATATSTYTSNNSAQQLSIEDRYVGENYTYYRNAFEMIRAGQNKFNWGAFWLSGYWPFYRKLYKLGFIIWGITFLITIISVLIDVEAISSLGILLSIYLGVTGNKHYFNKIEKLKSESEYYSEYDKEVHIKRNGGTSVAKGILIPVGIYIMIVIVGTIIIMATTKYCAADSCTIEVTNTKYCYFHKCGEYGCDRERVLFSSYCSQHKPISKYNTSGYSCIRSGCDNEAVSGGYYCLTHTCNYTGCNGRKYSSSEYCVSHTCSYGACYNLVVSGSNYCSEHR